MAGKRFPRIPKSIFSALGEIPVRSMSRKEADDDDCTGKYDPTPREIRLFDKSDPAQRWRVLCHEIIHVPLYERGLEYILTEKQTEAVCDAVGNFLAEMVVAGRLRFAAPPKE